MTAWQATYIAALALASILGRDRPGIVLVMWVGLLATLGAMLAMDTGALSPSGATMAVMVVDLACGAVLAFGGRRSCIIAAIYVAAIPIYAAALALQLPRDPVYVLLNLLGFIQCGVLSGGPWNGRYRRNSPDRGRRVALVSLAENCGMVAAKK